MNPYGSQIFIGGVWEASGSIGEGAEWMFGDHRAASHMTFVSMTTPNIHKVFPAIQKLPKRAGRGEDFKINYIREEFPLSRAVTQKNGGGGEEKKTEKLERFYQVCGLVLGFFKFVVNKYFLKFTRNFRKYRKYSPFFF